MKFIYSFLFISFSLCALPVRVLLQEHKKPVWNLQSDEGFQFKDPITGAKICFGASFFTLTITYEKGHFYINGKKINRKSLYIIPNKKYVQFGEGSFDGCMLLQRDAKRCYLMNLIDSEEYIFSVLKTESWPTWPIEMNKVQAIASRSYLLHQLLHSRKTDVPYHIKNTNYHQTYTGVHDRHAVRDAVKETEGIILSFNKVPILAMFDSCCGGIIPSKSRDLIDFSKAPYLDRPYGCSYCKKSKIYSWKAEYSYSEFRDVLQEGYNGILHDLSDVKIGAKDKAGVVKHIIAKTKKQEINFSAKEMYKLFKDVKSFSFIVTKKSQKITLQGKGYGHHLGLCQWGARELVARGWDYEKILKFYYPGTTIMKLEKS
jgi:stage II sporulation protein D